MCKAKELTNQILSIIDEAENTYNQFSKDQSQYDRMTEDIMHKIELTNFNASEGYMLCKQLQDVRRDRRQVKDEMEVLWKLCRVSKTIKQSLESVDRIITNVEYQQSIRGYRPRVLKEMRIKRVS